MPKLLHTLPVLAAAVLPLAAQSDAERRAVVGVERIWDRAPHCAFTDLEWWHGALWCTFREGSGHVPGTNGTVRLLVEREGVWRSFARIDEVGIDLRDPKLSVTPDGRLMVLMGGSRYEGTTRTAMAPRACFVDADERLSELQQLEIDPSIASGDDWLWRVTWSRALGHGYGAVYQGKPSGPELHLVRTTDGVRYEHVTRLELDGRPNETTLRFLPDGRMVALVRREEGDRRGHLGVSSPPFDAWDFRALPIRLGGPDLLVVPGSRPEDEPTLLAATRAYPSAQVPGPGRTRRTPSTVLVRLGLDGTAHQLLRLPSGGDTSYAGLVRDGDRLQVSFYSSHEGAASVYRAVLRLDELLALAR